MGLPDRVSLRYRSIWRILLSWKGLSRGDPWQWFISQISYNCIVFNELHGDAPRHGHGGHKLEKILIMLREDGGIARIVAPKLD